MSLPWCSAILILHHSIKCCSDMFTVIYRTRQGNHEMKIYSVLPCSRYHFVNWRELPRFPFMPQGSAYYKSKLEIISGEHGLSWNKLNFQRNVFDIMFMMPETDSLFDFAGIWLWWHFYAFWNCKLQRGKVWEYLDSLSLPSANVLEPNCGRENRHCIQKEHNVVATDVFIQHDS